MSQQKEKSGSSKIAYAVLKAAALTGIGSYIIKASEVGNFPSTEMQFIAVIASFGGVALLILAGFLLVETFELLSMPKGWRVILTVFLSAVFSVVLLSVTVVLWSGSMAPPAAGSN